MFFIKTAIKNAIKRRQLNPIYRRFKDFTMIPEPHFLDNLLLAESVQHVNGTVVECGVWRGGMSAGIASVLGPKRSYHLFDSFEGLPPAQQIDGQTAIDWQNNTNAKNYYNNCSAPIQIAENAMKQSGANNFILIKGWFNQTLPIHHFKEPIALLRLDGDWYESTLVCLENLYRHVAPGGKIIIDDYYTWDGCTRAVHDFLSRHKITDRIRSTGLTCYIEKQSRD